MFIGDDLVNYPDLALNEETAAKILVYGMMNGSFTNKSLSSYITDSNYDFFNARKTVNSLDKASLIEGYANEILTYL